MNTHVTAALLILLAAIPGHGGEAMSKDPLDYEQISVINLIATPERYDGKLVAATGFFRREFEHSVLHFSKEQAEIAIPKSGPWIEFGTEFDEKAIESFDDTYIMVFGRFDMKRNGHMGLSAGTIEGVWNVVGFTLPQQGSASSTAKE